MKYFVEKGREYIENGQSKARVSTLTQIPSPKSPDRVVRIFIVQEVLKQSPNNLLLTGSLVNLSFPSDKANAKKYKWRRGEESQVKFNIDLNGPTHTDGDPVPAKE